MRGKGMTETKIDVSELKGEGGDIVKELADFLKEKTKAEVETATNDMTVKGEGKAVSRVYLRVLLRKFLHKQGLREYFKVIGGKENALVVKGIKAEEEE
jgi:hypothetical protein